MKVKYIGGLMLALTLSAVLAVTAFAAETPADGSYGYLSGHQKSTSRHRQYEQAEALDSDAERETFFAENEIGGSRGGFSLDADALVSAGIIDQETADSILQYAADKHARLSGRYASMEDMTPAERHAHYAGFDRSGGDSVDALLGAGVITQEQADTIRAWLDK